MEIRKSEIANEVARLCKERGITQYELAKRSQLQESSVRNMFQKGTTPTYRTLSAICGGLGITEGLGDGIDLRLFIDKRHPVHGI